MHDRCFSIDKIRNEELRRFATEDSDEQVSVLIELDLPQRRVELNKINRGGMTINIPVSDHRGGQIRKPLILKG